MPGDSNKSGFNISQSVYYADNRGGIAGNSVTADISIGNGQKQNLAEAAAEIQQLLDQLSQTNPTTTTLEKLTVVSEVVGEIEGNPTLKARVIDALKAGGVEAFKVLIDHPLVNILIATIEGWREVE
ncbi:hypothetical protein [Moorena producens]|uniref:hypothetical protein n=1 Tax=Moorena producens TaxID=1155739 RepID=UPI003C77FB7C